MERPVLKYNGSKWLLTDWILEHFPAHKVYVDLFGGGGSVLLRKDRARFEYYNDVDGELCTFFRVLRDRPRELIRSIRFTAYSRDEFEITRTSTESELETARRFYARCWMNMSNNRAGGSFRSYGNVFSSGGYRPASMFADLRPLYRAAMRFRGVVIESKDYGKLLKECSSPETLFFVDPPYLGICRKAGRAYQHEMMSIWEHFILFLRLRKSPSMIVLCGYPSKLYEITFERAGWKRVEKRTRDNKRNERIECLWLNPACQKALGQQDLFPDFVHAR